MSKKTPEQQFKVLKKEQVGDTVVISGRKLVPPAKRIVLPLENQRVLSAKVIRQTKKGPEVLTIERINHLPSQAEVRLHTKETVFPGDYEVELTIKS